MADQWLTKFLRGCMNCWFRKAKPQVQQMGDLPLDCVNEDLALRQFERI